MANAEGQPLEGLLANHTRQGVLPGDLRRAGRGPLAAAHHQRRPQQDHAQHAQRVHRVHGHGLAQGRDRARHYVHHVRRVLRGQVRGGGRARQAARRQRARLSETERTQRAHRCRRGQPQARPERHRRRNDAPAQQNGLDGDGDERTRRSTRGAHTAHSIGRAPHVRHCRGRRHRLRLQ